MSRDWDAVTYDRVSTPQVQWALKVLDRLHLNGDETVLDAGCGSGRVTHLLEQRLPHGHVIAVDASPAMVEKAKETLRNDAEVFVSDLTELELDQVADAVFSNAVFHWIPDHDTLFKRMFAALKPGGRMVVQCGGAGNIHAFLEVLQEVAMEEPFAGYVADFAGPWYFASPAETAARLQAAGFVDAECWLHDAPVQPEEPREFVRTVCLGHHLERLPEELRPQLVERVLERTGKPLTLDYIRLNIDARRPE